MIGGMATDTRSLGTRIKEARLSKLWKQRDLAEAMGASVRAVGDWENDRAVPRNIPALERVLGTTLRPEPEPEPDDDDQIDRELATALEAWWRKQRRQGSGGATAQGGTPPWMRMSAGVT